MKTSATNMPQGFAEILDEQDRPNHNSVPGLSDYSYNHELDNWENPGSNDDFESNFY